jgi:hypothetical protein
MRFGIWAAAAVYAVWAAGPAHAQMGNQWSTALGGPPPSAIVQKPVDLSHVMAPTPGIAAQQNRFNFTALFSKLSIPSFPVKRGVSALPSPSSFPTYPNYKMVGQPPYQLGDPRAATRPFQPVLPIINNPTPPVGPGSK